MWYVVVKQVAYRLPSTPLLGFPPCPVELCMAGFPREMILTGNSKYFIILSSFNSITICYQFSQDKTFTVC